MRKSQQLRRGARHARDRQVFRKPIVISTLSFVQEVPRVHHGVITLTVILDQQIVTSGAGTNLHSDLDPFGGEDFRSIRCTAVGLPLVPRVIGKDGDTGR